MPYSEQEIEIAREVKKILDKGIQEGPWQANLFLKGIKKKLEELHSQFEADIGLDHLKRDASSGNSSLTRPLHNTTEIYISLYQSQGSNIQKWQEVIGSLVHYSMGRPIYKNEDDVRAAIQLTDRNPNNAYVVLKVNADTILADSAEQPRVDREGRKLIMLKEGSITLHNIVRLVHPSGHYKLVGNFLVKQA
ncbi:Dot/Icm secretion system protein [Candidatus Rickettsiella viridis]|uniref:Dot/Icm secretion system protein n=1 Tax=Candidatus Rickettsiella viridis TaxID=676208 RepID=A0A2Z5UVL7_9COXI|nr:Dot/Icm secretion system protein IcmQ [Candidatus Rickettsiella viridis]BBB15105.1 Dot/Icm secretion system protein [Candidatus Rickettsiella viridis]